MATKEENQRYKAKRKLQVLAYKSKFDGCVDCGRDDLPLEVYDLDHVRAIKRFAVSSYNQRSEGELAAELLKCDLRCPTCHALRHYNQRTVKYGRCV